MLWEYQCMTLLQMVFLRSMNIVRAHVQIHADLPKLRDLPPSPFLMHWGLEFISIHCMHGVRQGGTAYTYTKLCPCIHVHMCMCGHIFIASTHMNEQTGVNVSTCVGHMCMAYVHRPVSTCNTMFQPVPAPLRG